MLGERLIERGQINRDQLRIALTEQQRSGKKLGRLLVQYGFLDDGALRQVLAGMHGSEAVDLKKVCYSEAAVKCLPVEEAQRLVAVPVSLNDSEWVVACADTRSVRLRDRLRVRLPAGRQLRLLQAMHPYRRPRSHSCRRLVGRMQNQASSRCHPLSSL